MPHRCPAAPTKLIEHARPFDLQRQYDNGKGQQGGAQRYILSMTCTDPYMQEGLELIKITVIGQSFVLHQIRKMIGLTVIE